MRVWVLGYALLYLAFETVGYHLEQVGWVEVTGMDVATALTDAFLAVAIAAAGYVGGGLALQRWRRAVARSGTPWRVSRPEPAGWHLSDAPIGVASWRVEPDPPPLLAVPAVRYSSYGVRNDRAGRVDLP